MPYRRVSFQIGCYYHVYNRGNNRQPIFFHAENYDFFLRQVAKYLHPCADVVAYCLMPNHYHLLLCLKTATLDESMQPFALSYTKAINKRYERTGTLFQGPYKALCVDRDEYLLPLSRYIHLNPVDAGLVERAEMWPFSSYAEYLGLRPIQNCVPQSVLSQFPSPLAYRQFVEMRSMGQDPDVAPLDFEQSEKPGLGRPGPPGPKPGF